MTLLDHAPAPVAISSAAERHAGTNHSANTRALAGNQPNLAVPGMHNRLSWLYARDGALTARDGEANWWSGCSVPNAAARAMLKSLDVRGSTACFLNPPHAAAIRVALDALRPEQAIIAIVPDDNAFSVILACEDFSDDISRQRIWFVAGKQWPAQLDEILTTHPGLPTPTQFVRLLDGIEEPASDALVSPAQQVFSDHTVRRAARIAQLREKPRAAATPTTGCMVAPSLFRLWDDAGDALARVADEMGWTRFDPDIPTTASPLALAETVAGAGALLTANTARADLPNIVPAEVAWVTWLTHGRIPPFDAAGPRDALLVTDPRWCATAVSAGWPAERVRVAGWPAAPAPEEQRDTNGLVLIADVRPLDPPRQVIDLSSHRLLWELILDELRADPFLATPSVTAYLDARMRRFAIAPESLDRRLFIDALIVPAFVHGVARVLADERLQLRVFGAGWENDPKLASCWRGAVTTRRALIQAVAGARALVHPWPSPFAHPIDALGRPVLRAIAGRAQLIRSASAVLSGVSSAPCSRDVPPLTPQLVRNLFSQHA